MQSGWALGSIAAAILAAVILPRRGWRALFLSGAAPALIAWWIRRGIAEPAAWHKSKQTGLAPRQLLRPPLRRRLALLTALCCCLLFGYWGLFTWLPAYLSSPVSAGGAGLGIVKSSAWIVPMQAGAFFGYVLFGFLADRYGRRRIFLTFVLATAALVPIYALGGRSAALLLALGPLLGFFGHGYFSSLGLIAAELFPPAARATAQGLSYNAGRALSALAPATVGALADRHGLGASLALTSIFFVLGSATYIALDTEPRA
jgi:MFS family permease